MGFGQQMVAWSSALAGSASGNGLAIYLVCSMLRWHSLACCKRRAQSRHPARQGAVNAWFPLNIFLHMPYRHESPVHVKTS